MQTQPKLDNLLLRDTDSNKPRLMESIKANNDINYLNPMFICSQFEQNDSEKITPAFLNPSASPCLLLTQKSPQIGESLIFKQKFGLAASPLLIDKLMNTSNWLLSDFKLEKEDENKPAPEFDGYLEQGSDDDKSSDESMDENDNNKFTLMALSPVNRNDQRILDTFACATPQMHDEDIRHQNDANGDKKYSLENSKPLAISLEHQNTLSTPKTPTSDGMKDEVNQTYFQTQKTLLHEEQREQDAIDDEVMDEVKYEYTKMSKSIDIK